MTRLRIFFLSHILFHLDFAVHVPFEGNMMLFSLCSYLDVGLPDILWIYILYASESGYATGHGHIFILECPGMCAVVVI